MKEAFSSSNKEATALGQTTPRKTPYQAQGLPETDAAPAGMVRKQFRAMGTMIDLLLPTEQAQQGADAICELFAHWEQTLSRFLPESELSYLNQQDGIPTMVSPLLFTVIQTAFRAARASDGLYDPTLLNQMENIGYDRTFDDVPEIIPTTTAHSILASVPGGGWRGITLEPHLRLITLPQGIRVDVGGIAKGMAVDASLEHLRALGITTALVNAGGDLAVLGTPPAGSDWPLAIPGKEQAWIIPFHHGALATSGKAYRHWQQGMLSRHHIIDPRTGESAQSSLWSVTVAASTCEQAEVAAKGAFILGSEQGAAFLMRHNLAGLFIQQDGNWLATSNWPTSLMKQL